MAIDISTLTDYPWSDIAKAAKQAMVANALGGHELKFPDGRSITRCTMQEAKDLYTLASNMAAQEAAGDQGGGIALVRFGEAV